MRKPTTLALVCLFLSACSLPPISKEELTANTVTIAAMNQCISMGRVTRLNEVIQYQNFLKSVNANRSAGNSLQQAQLDAKSTLARHKVSTKDCHALEARSVAYVMKKEQQAQNQAALDAGFDALAQAGQDMQRSAATSMAQTTQCRYDQWGNMVFCN